MEGGRGIGCNVDGWSDAPECNECGGGWTDRIELGQAGHWFNRLLFFSVLSASVEFGLFFHWLNGHVRWKQRTNQPTDDPPTHPSRPTIFYVKPTDWEKVKLCVAPSNSTQLARRWEKDKSRRRQFPLAKPSKQQHSLFNVTELSFELLSPRQRRRRRRQTKWKLKKVATGEGKENGWSSVSHQCTRCNVALWFRSD